MPSSTCRYAWFNYTSVAPLPSIPIDGAGPRHNRPSGTEVFKVRTEVAEARETSAVTTHLLIWCRSFVNFSIGATTLTAFLSHRLAP